MHDPAGRMRLAGSLVSGGLLSIQSGVCARLDTRTAVLLLRSRGTAVLA